MAKKLYEESNIQAIADAIRGKNGETTTYKPSEMAAAITNIPSGGGGLPEAEPIVLTGNCSYLCKGTIASNYIALYGDTISTQGITNSDSMFMEYKNKNIPFALQYSKTSSASMQNLFADAVYLEVLPAITNCKPGNLTRLFSNCKQLKRIEDDIADTWDLSYIQTYNYGNLSYIFSNCRSIRYIPASFLKKIYGATTSGSYIPYNNLFYYCGCLDEIHDLGVHNANLTSNAFSSTFDQCNRLKSITFATDDNGYAQKRTWTKQTVNLSYYVGYASNASSITAYGIGTDKQVTDAASYEALKNDADWWTTDVNYSRYNHDSAVETINSLPDCPGQANTIKFMGAAGSATDGGAINTLTEEEIAVATAKGWTVTLA